MDSTTETKTVAEESGKLIQTQKEARAMQWEKPKCHVTHMFPFIPTEQEIDALISGSGKKTTTFLQLLKETAMRSGEAKRLEWINIDFEKT